MEAIGSTVKPKRAPRSTRKHQEVLGSTGKHQEALGSLLELVRSTRKHLEGTLRKGSAGKH